MAEFQFKLKRGKQKDLIEVNPFLLQGEPCFEIDTFRLKIGNGVFRYNELPYVNDIEHIEEEEIKQIVQELLPELLPEECGCYWNDITPEIKVSI